MPSRSRLINKDEVVHPGVILRQMLDEHELTQRDLSEAIGKSTPVINDILQRRRSISPEIAYMLEAVIPDIPAVEWLTYQCQYDLAIIRQNDEVAERRKNLESWNELKSLFNTSYLKKKLGLTGTPEENMKNVFQFFGVSSIRALQEKASFTEDYFRQSTALSVDPNNLMTWMLMVRKKSDDLPTPKNPFDVKQVGELIQKLNYTFYKNEDTKEKTGRILNKYGIKFVIEQNLDRTPVDGYSFWEGDSPTIAVSLRYKRLDNFAFSVMHELGHIVKHIKKNKRKDYIDIISPKVDNDIEMEANDFAVNALNGGAPFDELFAKLSRSPFTAKIPIENAARAYKISPSIITGQFQHYCGIYSACRDLLKDVK